MKPFFVALLLFCSACAYQGGGFSEVGSQKFQWFSYLDADDIRASCVEGFTAYRLTYNAEYTKHIRSYEIWVRPDGTARYLARVQGEASLTRITTADLLAPWRWSTSEDLLTAEQVTTFQAKLAESGFYTPAPGGSELYFSGDYYWLAAACENGAMKFNIWGREDPGFDSLTFPEFLYFFDGTGKAVPAVRQVDPGERYNALHGGGARDRDPNVHFEISVSDDGLRGR